MSPQVEEALYHFYTGKTYLQEQKCYDAMEEFLLAGQLCGSTDKVVLKGQICYHKGLLYVNKMDYSNALEMFSNALEYYALAGSDVREHIMYAYEGMADVYAINGNPQESVALYRKASEMAAVDGRTGKPQINNYKAYCLCPNNPDYQRISKYLANRIFDLGVDGMMNDDIQYHKNACACEYCRKKGNIIGL